MNKTATHLHPTPDARVSSARDTVLETVGAVETTDLSHHELIANYQAIIARRAIHFPVPFHFVRELGKGRQGVVFLAIRQGARGCLTRHAVKLHDPGLYSSADRYWNDMGRLATQVSKLQPVHSDNLVTREAYDECDGIGYLQMSVIDGIDLQFLLEGTHVAIARSQSTDEEWDHFMRVLFRLEEDRFMLQPGLAMHILGKILLGLVVVHEAGFLHADVKPSNIMIDRMGSVKLVDFGRAVRVGEPISILLGSPLYMAPETHRLEPGWVQSDLYGTGLVCLEMLRGQSLSEYGGMDNSQLLDFKMGLLKRFDALLPAHVAERRPIVRMLKRFLQPEPADRFTSSREAEETRYRLRGLHRDAGQTGALPEYDRELQRYLEKISNPDTGHLNPRLT